MGCFRHGSYIIFLLLLQPDKHLIANTIVKVLLHMLWWCLNGKLAWLGCPPLLFCVRNTFFHLHFAVFVFTTKKKKMEGDLAIRSRSRNE